MLTNLKNNLLLVFIFTTGILAFLLYMYGKRLESITKEKNDNKTIYEISKDSLKAQIKTWQDKDSQNHVSTKIFTLNSEKLFDKIIQQEALLKNLSTKLNRLEGYRITATESKYSFYGQLKDSILYDTIPVKTFEQIDPKGYYTFKTLIKDDSIKSTLASIDTVVTGLSKCKSCKRPNKLLFFRYGPKPYQVELVNKNPSNKITYQKEIYLKKN